MAKFISKTDRLIPKDWTYPESIVPTMPTLNYEMLNSMLAQQQGQFDLARTISEKTPNVLNNDLDQQKYQVGQQIINQGIDNVSQSYLKSPSEGSRAYREYLNQVKGLWKPGGEFDKLNKRYEGYNIAVKAIDEQYKDDPSPVNKTLAKLELQKQLANPIDTADGLYTPITTPTLYKNPNFRSAINEMIKQIGEDGDTTFLGNKNKDFWITKIKEEGRPAERIKLATQALSEQPEFAAQIQRDAQYQALNIDPDKYQSQFNSRLDKQYEQNSKLLEGKNAKELLEQQGYDTSDLKQAKKQFLEDQKTAIEQTKATFNLNQELAKDVYKDYENYALGFVTKKVDKDLIANQAVKWQMEDRRARERNNALFSISDSLKPQAAPTGTVTSGIAQQLPQIDKHYTDLKTKQSEIKSSVDKILTDPSSTFNGWKMEDVASVTNLWKSTMDKLPANTPKEVRDQAFAQALQASGTYQWKPDQIGKVINEFDSVDGPAIAPALNAYQDLQYEVERVDNARTNVALQYIDTPEGKQSFNVIKGFRKAGESDEQLVQRALNNPEQFQLKETPNAPTSGGFIPSGLKNDNAANFFKNNMQKDIKENKSGVKYDWGDMATTEVRFNSDDKLMLPFVKTMGEALENGSQYRFSSEGKQGLTFRDSKGNEIPVSAEDKVNFTTGTVTKDVNGKPVMTYNANVTRGNKTHQTTVKVDIVPGSPEAEQILSGLKNTYVGIYNSGNKVSANAVLDNILAIEKPTSLQDASTQVMVDNLTRNKTQPLTNVYKQDNSGKLIPASSFGYSGIDTHNDHQTIDPATGAILNYKTFAFIDQTGNKSVADVYVAPNGTMVMKEPSKYMSTISQERLGATIRATTPVIRETQKLPNGQLINLMTNEGSNE